MPKFMTYQRPASFNTTPRGGRPGAPIGKPGKRTPKAAPEQRNPVLDIKLPGLSPIKK